MERLHSSARDLKPEQSLAKEIERKNKANCECVRVCECVREGDFDTLSSSGH